MFFLDRGLSAPQKKSPVLAVDTARSPAVPHLLPTNPTKASADTGSLAGRKAPTRTSGPDRTSLTASGVAKLRLVDGRTTAVEVFSPSIVPLTVLAPSWARKYRTRLAASDLAVIAIAVVAAFVARFWFGETAASFAKVASNYWLVTAVIIGTWIITLSAHHTRDTSVVGMGLAEYQGVVKASILAFGLLAIAFVILKIDVARGYFTLAFPLGICGLLISRWAWRKWLIRQRRAGKSLSRAIVVGSRPDVEYVIGQIDRKAVTAYDIVGACVDDSNDDQLISKSTSVPVVSRLSHVAEAAANLKIDAVIVAGQPNFGNNFIRDLAWDLEGTAAELVVASRLTNIAGPRIRFRPVEGLPLMHVELPQFTGGKHVLKRGFDVCLSGLAIIALLPLMLVISLLVGRDSAGPVIFRQERVGRGGQTFHILKFRSMVESAEDDLAGLLDKNEGAGSLFKMKNDPRITRVGKFLRRYSIDELPQLWNIFVGDMSLVGPRPPLPGEVENYDPRVHRRLYIKPGLTGMWQVNGRSNLDWDESVRLDLYYVENWSLTGDLVIIWRTFKVLRRAVGAY
ncbi:MAG: sugar transferase [Microbacteriaceae bacterium]|nr:sugar transferase [Microbacteriaceae bacterium]